MENRITQVDVACGESQGNGGDIQFQTNDLAKVYGNENQTYIAMFGGNVQQSTKTVRPNTQRFDFWGNDLLFSGQPNRQYNSETERTLNVIKLNSAGRAILENAVKADLQYLTSLGATVTVNVIIISVNRLQINIDTVYADGKHSITVINFGRSGGQGDFSLLDFNEDFN